MVTELERKVQRRDDAHTYAIVDEVDNILIDEARTPLIISGPAEETEEVYRTFTRIVPRLAQDTDFVVDIKHKSVSLTDEGASKVEKGLGIKNLYDPANFRLTRFLDAALHAQCLFHRDQQYVVKDGEVVIVDEFTGRLMYGRRWSDGLHQAVEAKEGVKIQRESITYATITLQNYFRLYKKLAGMTGTAWTEREEFHQIYGLDVIIIPTHRDMIREDGQDLVFRGEEGKFHAVVVRDRSRPLRGPPRPRRHRLHRELGEARRHAQAPLRMPPRRLRRPPQGLPPERTQVLNAKQHEREAHIIAQAGSYGVVTIATNMAGRGTDIILGGNPERLAEEIARKRGKDLISLPQEEAEKFRHEAREAWQIEHDRVVAAGGLHIIGTERHEARRIDNQLRGRAGRQGDPGSSRFYVSFGDDVMRRFSPEWVPNLLGRMGMDENTPLESGMVSKAIEQAQTKVEGHNFDIRKHVVQYDDVMNRQRDLIYTQRRRILEASSVPDDEAADIRSNIVEMIDQEIERAFDAFGHGDASADSDIPALITELKTIMPLPTRFNEDYFNDPGDEDPVEQVIDHAHKAYEDKEKELGAERMRTLERLVLLGAIDRLWVYHLTALDEMRQGIGLTGYGGRDPLVEYKREAHDMYVQLTDHIRQQVVRRIFHVTLTTPVAARPVAPPQAQESGPAKESTDGAQTNGKPAARRGLPAC